MIGAMVMYKRMENRPGNYSSTAQAMRNTKILAETAETGAESAETKTSSCGVRDSRIFCLCISCL